MGTMADRNSGISRFVKDMLEKQGLVLYEKWFTHLQGLRPDQKIKDLEVRDEMLQEILGLATQGNALILSKKDKGLVEDILNIYLSRAHLLQP